MKSVLASQVKRKTSVIIKSTSMPSEFYYFIPISIAVSNGIISVIETGGANRISSIKLEGKPELFEKKSPSEQPKSEL